VLSSDDVAPARQHAHGADVAAPAPTRAAIRFAPLPTTPAAVIDLALIVPDGTTAGAVESSIRATAGDLLEACQLFDEFRGAGVAAGSRSLAWRLTFRHPERTLKDREIEGRRAKLLETLARDLGVTPRSA
jgi:phenylalanyl-tRNA synthetase beta chain